MSEETKEETEEVKKSGLTVKAFFTGILLVVLWTLYSSFAGGVAPVAAQYWAVSSALMWGAPILMVLLLLLVSRRLKNWGFTAQELTVVYAMLFSSFVIGLWASLDYGLLIAGNVGFKQTIPWTPSLWMPTNLDTSLILRGRAVVPWGAWTAPIAFWSLFVISFILYNLCFQLILSHRTINVEMVPFPLEQAVASHAVSRARKPLAGLPMKLLLVGIVIGFIVQSTYQLLHALVPAIPAPWPEISYGIVAYDLGPSIGPGASNMLLLFTLGDLPLYIGLFFLVPVSVLATAVLSTVFFWDILAYIEVRLGWVMNINEYGSYDLFGWWMTTVGTYSPSGIQVLTITSMGFPLGVALIYLALSSKTLGASFKSAIQGRKTGPFSSRLLWLGFIGSLLVWIVLVIASELPILFALLFAAINLLIMFAFTRFHGEAIAGGMDGDNYLAMTDLASLSAGGDAMKGTGQMYRACQLGDMFARGLIYGAAAPACMGVLASLRVCETTKTKWKGTVIASVIAIIVAFLIGHFFYIWGAYTWGLQVKFPAMYFHHTQAISYLMPTAMTPGTYQFVAVPMRWMELVAGIVIAAAVTLLKFRFVWFPLHPMGLLLASAGFALTCWFQALLALIAKYAVLKIGGTRLYEEKGVPIALGLIVGYTLCTLIYGIVLTARTLA